MGKIGFVPANKITDKEFKKKIIRREIGNLYGRYLSGHASKDEFLL